MKKSKAIFYIVAVVLLLCVEMVKVHAQGTTSKGTEFWTAYMLHIGGAGAGGSRMVLYITSDVSTTGTVTVADGSAPENFTVTANNVTLVEIPSSAYVDGSGIYAKGIHIVAAKPVAVYAHIFQNNVSGATLLLPVNTMGKDYMSINYKQDSNQPANSFSTFAVIATEDSTSIAITPSATLMNGHRAGVTDTIVLHKGQVYQALSVTDLTGSKIKSISTTLGICKKIAVFSGSSKIGIGCSGVNNRGQYIAFSSDNLFQQVYPTSTWGKKYISAPLAGRNFDIYRIILSDKNTNVTLNGSLITNSFVNDLYYEFTSTSSNIIEADKPIQVVQYTASQNQVEAQDCTIRAEGAGDPEMIYLTPVEQGLNRVTLFSADQARITSSYINVIMPTDGASGFRIDGVPYNNFLASAGSGFSYAQIPVSNGPHTITSPVAFNAIAYGFGQAESYGYAAGANLQDLNNYVAFQDPQSADTTVATACKEVFYRPQLTVPYMPTRISWDLGKGDPPTVFTSPVPTRTFRRNNIDLYVYEYPTKVVYPVGSSNNIIATVFNPVAGECGASQDLIFTFIVNEPASKSVVEVPPNICLGKPAVFKDVTVHPAGAISKKWLWDFGDNTPISKVQQPSHIYAAPGNYYARLTVTDDNGCVSISDSIPVHVTRATTAGFTVSTPCVNKTVVFTSTSTAEGTIKKFTWDFGDGTIVDDTTGAPVTHIYAIAKTYPVKLTITTSFGCVEVAPKDVLVNPIPVVDFTIPDVCLTDAYAQFSAKSTIADNTEGDFIYSWNFGDNSPLVSGKNPRHRYTATGNFNVTLKVTSKYGCDTSKTYVVAVNGSNPVARFTIDNVNNLCSSNEVIFNDMSVADIGNITKLVWYFDYSNRPDDTVVYNRESIRADRKYSHKFPFFNTPADKHYKIRLIAYSGQTCFSVYDYPVDVIVHANPIVELSLSNNGSNITSALSVCQGDEPLQIYEKKGTYTGNGIFSGKGISSTGLFDPTSAGAGTHTITYTFQTQFTCPFTTTFDITVNPKPQVSVTPNLTVLAGFSIKLNAKASIASGTMKYKWTPSTGLDKDDILTPTARPLVNTTYKLLVTSDKDCYAEAEVTVEALQPPVIPNSFTPNGDGINDTWEISNLNTYPGATVEVFNRYGERMFSSVGYTTSWDGRYKGTALPTGTYYYIVSPKNGRTVLSGSITIIR